MTYERINFVNQSVERPRTYEMTHNPDGSVTLVDSFGLVDELGTPINADTMNHLEDGISATAIRKYNVNETFAFNEWVLATATNETNFYKSLKDNNLGNPLTDTNYWEVVKIGGGGGTGLQLFDIVAKDHILTYAESQGFAQLGTYVYKTAVAGSRYGYETFYNKCVSEYNNATSTEEVNGVTVKVCSNGHKYYNISDKSKIDTYYSNHNIAWFYGIDTTNQRIFLPRADENRYNKRFLIASKKPTSSDSIWYNLYSDGWCEQGGDIGTITTVETLSTVTFPKAFADTNYQFIYSANGRYRSTGSTTELGNSAQNKTASSIDVSIWGESNSGTINWIACGYTSTSRTAQTEYKYKYMVVGNTVTDTSNIDVVTQTQNGVKDIDDAVDDGLARLNSVDALKTTQITNCVVEAPQNIKYEIGETGITIKAGTLVVFPYGTEDLSSTYTAGSTFFSSQFTVVKTLMKSNRFYVLCKTNSDYKLSKHGIRNTNFLAQFGVDTSTNGQIFILTKPTSCSTGTTDYTDYTERHTHWNITTNLIKSGNVNVDETNRILALPIFECYVGESTTDDGDYIPESVVEDFNVAGYFANAIWQADGIKIAYPNGRNADGSLNNIIVPISFNVTYITMSDISLPGIMFGRSSGSTPAWYRDYQIYYQNDKPFTPNNTAYGIWYSPQENVWRVTNPNSQWNIVTYCPIAEFVRSSKNAIIVSMKTSRPFQAVDYSEINNEVVVVTDTYSNGSSWYRVWSDGWCEQGGYTGDSTGEKLITLLKPFINMNYNVQLTYGGKVSNSNTMTMNENQAYGKTTYDFKVYDDQSIGKFWEAKGYIS